MNFEAKLAGFVYRDGTSGDGWPDYVTVDNGGILLSEYDTRTYYPIDRDALLKLADEIELDGAGSLDDDDWCKPLLVEYAQRIREALGVTDEN